MIGVVNDYRRGTWTLHTDGGSMPLVAPDQLRSIEVIRDPFGEMTVEAPLSILPVQPLVCPRSIRRASALTFAGQPACVSGCFPDVTSAFGLLLDGTTELAPWGIAPTTVMLGVASSRSSTA